MRGRVEVVVHQLIADEYAGFHHSTVQIGLLTTARWLSAARPKELYLFSLTAACRDRLNYTTP